jgi:hypothetical protein
MLLTPRLNFGGGSINAANLKRVHAIVESGRTIGKMV